MSRALRLWGPVVAWMAVIFAVSSRSLPAGAALIPDWSTHGGAYALLSLLACRALAGGLGQVLRGRDALLAVVLSAAYGVSDELHQRFVPGRQAELADVAKDVAGGLVGACLYRWLFDSRSAVRQEGVRRG